MFFASQTEPERAHIVSALVFELSKCLTPRVREAVVSRLANIDRALAAKVAAGLGLRSTITPAPVTVGARDMAPSSMLSLLAKATPTFEGRKVGVLLTDGCDGDLVSELKAAVEAAGGKVEIIAPAIGGVITATGDPIAADHRIDGGPSCLFDAVAILPSDGGGAKLALHAAAVDFLRDAFGHLKVIGYLPAAAPLFVKGGVNDATPDTDPGLIAFPSATVKEFVEAASAGRIWAREAMVRPAPSEVPASRAPQFAAAR
jgi:catalase